MNTSPPGTDLRPPTPLQRFAQAMYDSRRRERERAERARRVRLNAEIKRDLDYGRE